MSTQAVLPILILILTWSSLWWISSSVSRRLKLKYQSHYTGKSRQIPTLALTFGSIFWSSIHHMEHFKTKCTPLVKKKILEWPKFLGQIYKNQWPFLSNLLKKNPPAAGLASFGRRAAKDLYLWNLQRLSFHTLLLVPVASSIRFAAGFCRSPVLLNIIGATSKHQL